MRRRGVMMEGGIRAQLWECRENIEAVFAKGCRLGFCGGVVLGGGSVQFCLDGIEFHSTSCSTWRESSTNPSVRIFHPQSAVCFGILIPPPPPPQIILNLQPMAFHYKRLSLFLDRSCGGRSTDPCH
ncbi:hypothetical protein CDAR_556771 [Caerostris darwini]|uniref:Uncharacterized protein n=1 Tax=Caerostris darwini TaxID=1538125 RepID=A0AAV4REG3_9ARAC|nr:hypothetical protein CDAR_556771 [Caerostris darwini]